MSKKVSLILTTYNSAENLLTTFESIAAQDYSNIEVVIKDGGSTDETLTYVQKFIEEYGDRIEVITESSPDKGLYDAMNRGIELCTGDIIAVCNDTFTMPDAISRYVSALVDENGEFIYDVVHSDLVYAEGDKVIRTWKMGPGTAKDLRRGWMPGHPSLYIRKEVYEKYGSYKTDYKIAADYEFMVRMLRDGSVRLNYIPETLISMYYGGTSSSSLASYIKSFFEGYRALRENHVPLGFFITVLRTFKVLSQF